MNEYSQQSLIETLSANGFQEIYLGESGNHHFASLEQWVNLKCPNYRKYQETQARWYATFSKQLEIAIVSDSVHNISWNVYPDRRAFFPGINKVRQFHYNLLLINHWITRRITEGWNINEPANVWWTEESINSLSFGAQDCFLLGLNETLPGTNANTTPLIRLQNLNIAALQTVERTMLSFSGHSRQTPSVYWTRATNNDAPLAGEVFHADDFTGSPEQGYGRRDAEQVLAQLKRTDPAWEVWTNPEQRWVYLIKRQKDFMPDSQPLLPHTQVSHAPSH